ncbi:MAG: hypothetical protein P4L50_29860 [Anaerolineaceae bacterium]|nr:hypothetical protein [Anaerolineaceae bacterium]
MIGLIDPGIDIVVRLEVRWPGGSWFWFAALSGLLVGGKPLIVRRQVRDDIFDGPVTGHAALIHTFWTNLSEQCFPLPILFLQPIQKI